MMTLLTTKVVAMVLLGGISLVVGLVPLLFTRCLARRRARLVTGKTEVAISCLACFGGGVILTTCLANMLPEVNHFLRLNIENGLFPDTGLPVAEMLVLSGFFMIYIVEEVTHICIDRCCAGKGNNASDSSEIIPMMLHRGHSNDGNKYNDSRTEIKPMGQEDGEAAAEEWEMSDSNRTLQEKDASFEAALRGFLVIVALSFHELFEGIALGLSRYAGSVWVLFFAIASHKYLICFCLGMQFVSSGIRPCLSAVYVSTFALVTLVGTGIGIALSESVPSESSVQNNLVVILQGLATGTLLYVVFFEIIEKERSKDMNGIVQVGFLILGFTCMLCVTVLELLQTADGVTGDAGKSSYLVWPQCQMSYFDQDWKLPVNLTCVEGELQLLQQQQGRDGL